MDKNEMMAAAAVKRIEWLMQEGFSEFGLTYCYYKPDSYERRAELKKAGFKYNKILGWHAPHLISSFENDVIEINVKDIVDFSAWGNGTYHPNSKDYVNEKILEAMPSSKSEWIEAEDNRIKNLSVIVEDISEFSSQFGPYMRIKFKNGENTLIWNTTSSVVDQLEIGKKYLISANIKQHKIYLKEKYTIITRAKIEEEED